MKKKYYISFDGYVTIEANTIEEAEEKFWSGLTCITEKGYDDYYDINLIESDDEAVYKPTRKEIKK